MSGHYKWPPRRKTKQCCGDPGDCGQCNSLGVSREEVEKWEGGGYIPTHKLHPDSARFHELCDETKVMHDKKQKDYGTDQDPFANVTASEDFGVQPWLGAVLRLNDKVNRLKAFALRGELENEAIEDSFRDIAVYALIAQVLYEKANDK